MNQPSTKPSFKEYLAENGRKPGALIPLLQAAQDEFSYVSEEAVADIAKVTGKSTSDIWGVVTFYKQFRLTPMGTYCIKVCDGTACHVNNSKELIETVSDELGINQNETTEDGKFTFLTVACIGCCSLAPVMMINNDTYGNLTAKTCRKIIKDYKKGKYDK